MEEDCEKAVEQIVAKKYAQGLYGYTQISCYGIAFFRKQAKVKKLMDMTHGSEMRQAAHAVKT